MAPSVLKLKNKNETQTGSNVVEGYNFNNKPPGIMSMRCSDGCMAERTNIFDSLKLGDEVDELALLQKQESNRK
jgi:hypothetical protein